jgi:DNA-binding LacI/PurR family transcriptional regulator
LASFSKNTHDFAHFEQLIENEIPLVFFDRENEELDTDTVTVDDYSGAYQAVNHLINLGCKRIAFYSAPQHLGIGKRRLEGYKSALEKKGLSFDPDLVYACDNFEDAIKISRTVLKKQERPDAVFAVNDLTAIGVMKTAKQLGLNIPEDLKIVGFENSSSAQICEPELTTVDQFGYELGKKATELLLKRIKSGTSEYDSEKQVVRTNLVVRHSA